MENRERDRVSQRTSSTEAGDINRRTSQEQGSRNSGTSTEFGQNIGRSENLSEDEGENMDNRKSNKPSFDEESSRRPSDESYGSSQGRQGQSDIERERDSEMKNQGERSRRGSMGSSSESEH